MKDRDFFASKERNKGRVLLALVLVALLIFCSLDVTRAETVENNTASVSLSDGSGGEISPDQAEITEASAESAAANVTGRTGSTIAPKTYDSSNMPLWVASTVLLLLMLCLLTLMGRNFGLFPYPAKEQMNQVIKKLCNTGARHGKLRYLMFFMIIVYVFLMSLYKYLFFSEAARRTYAKA